MTEGPASVVATNGGHTSYQLDGAGPPVVLVHGLQVGQELFDTLRGHLLSSFTVITYDQRDRGKSAFAGDPYTIDDLADDLAELITALGYQRAHVLGTSYGGMVAQAFALRHPDRLDRLVLGATGQSPPDPDRLPENARALLVALETGDTTRAETLLRQMAPAVGRHDRRLDAGEVGAAQGRALSRRFAATQGFDTRGRLGSVTARTLVVHGREDPAVRWEDVLAMTAEIPRASMFLIEGAGHAWENERAEFAAAMLAGFLADP
nr:alpha/beta hydrolase [Dactylosporangium thailandense]